MNDLIRREAAINTVFSMLCKWDTEDPEDLKNMLLLAFQELPSAQPTEASCWGCNCQKMERLKEQKTFSEMVHLHDAETHEKRTEERTEKHACDFIDRQAAIDALDAICERGCEYSKPQRAVMCGACRLGPAFDVVDELPSAQQWIPVSERLPEEDTDVLISYRYKEGEGDTSHVYIDITSYGDMYFGGRKVKGAKHWRPPFEYFTSNYEVIAWMPLPEPWRGEEG